MAMIPNFDGVIESPVEPVKNRRRYWLNTTNNEIYILENKKYRLLDIGPIKMKGEIPEGLSFNQVKRATESSVYTHAGKNNNTLPGFPKNAANYGTLITLNPHRAGYDTWRCTQIYIPVNPYANGIYVRNDNNDWSKISATKVEGVPEPTT